MTQAATSGASARGAHYLADWRTCPIKAFFRHLAPHPDNPEGRGLESMRTGKELLIGWGVHEGLAEWYRSRCKDGEDTGEPNLDAAVAMIEKQLASRMAEFHDDEYQPSVDLCRSLLFQYHEHWGPGGKYDETKGDLIVVVDENGEPMVEREFVFDLGYESPFYGQETFTTRLDLVAYYHNFLAIPEHKTTSASSESRLYTRMSMDAQALGEFTALSLSWPDHTVNGVLTNALVKNRGAKSDKPAFNREMTTFDPLDVDKFLRDAKYTLEQRDDYLLVYHQWLDKGMSVWQAAHQAFPQYGRSTGGCVGFGSCIYLNTCRAPGREHETTRAFRPKSFDKPESKEQED